MSHEPADSDIEAPLVATKALRATRDGTATTAMQVADTTGTEWQAKSFPTLVARALDGVPDESDGRAPNVATQLAAITAHGLRSLTQEQIGKVVQRTGYSRDQINVTIEVLADMLNGA